MSNTTIEWTKHPALAGSRNWNPVQGCSHAGSPGCDNCYAEEQVRRGAGPGRWADGLIRWPQRHDKKTGLPMVDADGKPVRGAGRWSGVVRPAPTRILAEPLGWRSSACVFVNSTTDLFHEALVDTNEGRRWIAAVFGVMAARPDCLFLILTKRPAKMLEWFQWLNGEAALAAGFWGALYAEMVNAGIESSRARDHMGSPWPWPLPNVWIGVSAERQQEADERIPLLLQAPAALRFVSYEPALGPVDFGSLPAGDLDAEGAPMLDALRGSTWWPNGDHGGSTNALGWIIAGGESGSKARPSHPGWYRAVRDQCDEAGVPFFFKQWGAWGVEAEAADVCDLGWLGDGARVHFTDVPTPVRMKRYGSKGAAGHLLDGKAHREFPEFVASR
jgi:protein gp37